MTTRPMRVGIFIGSMNGGMRDGAIGWRELNAMALRAEEIGFDSFWLPDHLLFKDPGVPPHAPWECWSLMAALAATTSRLELGTAVTCVGFREPALLAKMATTVDAISNGRLILGLGAGWHEPEYDAYGYDYTDRFDRFEEATSIIRTLLREGRIDHEGRFYTLRDCELLPRGPRPDGPPILIGALNGRPRMLRLCAQYADLWNGWLLHARSHPDEVPALQADVEAACRQVGRDPATLGRTVGIGIDQRPAAERPEPVPGRPVALTGTVEELAEALRGFARNGITHLQISPRLDGVAGVEALAPVLELLDRDGWG